MEDIEAKRAAREALDPNPTPSSRPTPHLDAVSNTIGLLKKTDLHRKTSFSSESNSEPPITHGYRVCRFSSISRNVLFQYLEIAGHARVECVSEPSDHYILEYTKFNENYFTYLDSASVEEISDLQSSWAYACQRCFQKGFDAYYDHDTRDEHVRKDHDYRWVEDGFVKRYRCKPCGGIFDDERALLKHTREHWHGPGGLTYEDLEKRRIDSDFEAFGKGDLPVDMRDDASSVASEASHHARKWTDTEYEARRKDEDREWSEGESPLCSDCRSLRIRRSNFRMKNATDRLGTVKLNVTRARDRTTCPMCRLVLKAFDAEKTKS
ncbi:hypothetical protein BU16DRAFT_370533 [Lophium mytilinum]|uniref:C2H2-type domain-containing protein n=1 Tax=Lophium mytilinum TaxID=390894 RepID=A0A6A6QUN7_9PEZI|nr:hypothetical protein BU16DRAFT_370533 [Lophium mytilinum]